MHPEKPGKVIGKLRRAGFEGPFGGDKHVVMRHPQTRKKVPIPVHGTRDIPIGTLRAILRRAGISPKKWQEL